MDAGRKPEQFGRIWIHTHPGNSAEPSGMDEATFARVFGRADWALMFILARGGQCYARLRFNVGPGGDSLRPVEVDYSRPFAGSDLERWQDDYRQLVQVPAPEPPTKASENGRVRIASTTDDDLADDWWRDAWGEYADFDRIPTERVHDHVHDF